MKLTSSDNINVVPIFKRRMSHVCNILFTVVFGFVLMNILVHLS